jgi:hypothetical protein
MDDVMVRLQDVAIRLEDLRATDDVAVAIDKLQYVTGQGAGYQRRDVQSRQVVAVTSSPRMLRSIICSAASPRRGSMGATQSLGILIARWRT